MRSADGRFEYWGLNYKPVAAGTLPAQVCRFAFRCRQGADWCSVLLRNRGQNVPNKMWDWDGNLDRPTLTPSINCTTPRDDGQPCWHGWLKQGTFMQADNKTPEQMQ